MFCFIFCAENFWVNLELREDFDEEQESRNAHENFIYKKSKLLKLKLEQTRLEVKIVANLKLKITKVKNLLRKFIKLTLRGP